MKVVIVGASGFVGGYLTRELESAGHSTVKVDLPEVNLLNADQVESLIESTKPDAVVNLAAISSVGASWKCPADTISVNVNGTLNLLEAIRKHAPQAKTLLIGSAEEYAIPEGNKALKETDPLEASNPYGISKIAQENFAQLYRKKYGMKIVCTRSFNHTGVGQTTTFALPSFVKQVAAIDKSGKPLRATADLSMNGFNSAVTEQKSPLLSPDRTKARTMTEDNNIWNLAEKEYGDVREWRRIADANDIMNPLDIPVGTILKVPSINE